MMVVRLYRGLPRRFWLMKENRAMCSMRFHLLVPGGRWQTLISMPSSRASFCNSTVHNRTRFPLEPPQSAVIDEQLPAPGVSRLPQALPPAPDALHRECRRIAADPDIDPADIVDHVMDTAGDRLARLLVGKVMDADLFGGAFRTPLAARIPEIPHQFPSSWCPPRSPAARPPQTLRPDR